MKKELKFKIYNYECIDCGHKTWRDFFMSDPICNTCGSTNQPLVIEDVLVKEVEVYDSYTPEQYEEAKRIAKEIMDGKPLEEIVGLHVGDDLNKVLYGDVCYVSVGAQVVSQGFIGCLSVWDRTLVLPEELQMKNNYY